MLVHLTLAIHHMHKPIVALFLKFLNKVSNSFYQNPEKLRDAAFENDEPGTVQALHEIVPTFVNPEEYNKKATASMKAIQETA